MRISFLIQDITTQGGTERTTCCLANEMVRHGHEVCIVSVFRAMGDVQYPLLKEVDVSYLSTAHYGLDLSIVRRFARVLRQAWALRKNRLLQQSDVIISQKVIASLLSCIAGFGKKTIACEHYAYGRFNSMARWARNRLYNHVRGLVVLTERDRALFRHHGVRRVWVVENMVSIQPEEWRGHTVHRAMSVGRLDKQKGYDLLLHALAGRQKELGDWQVDIYGDGDERGALEAQAQALQLDGIVHFLPFTKQIEKAYATHAFYIMSSRFEGFPMVLLEAAASGLPVVSFDCPSGPAILLQQARGVLVANGDTRALGDAIVRLANDANKRQFLHEQACKIVAPYTPQAIYAKWIKLFETCKII